MFPHNKFVKFAQQVGLGRVNCTRPLQKRYVARSRMSISPESYSLLANKYSHLKFKLFFVSALLMILFFIGSSFPTGILWSVIVFLASLSTLMFFTAIFLHSFKSLDSQNSYSPFWYRVARITEWFKVILFTTVVPPLAIATLVIPVIVFIKFSAT